MPLPHPVRVFSILSVPTLARRVAPHLVAAAVLTGSVNGQVAPTHTWHEIGNAGRPFRVAVIPPQGLATRSADPAVEARAPVVLALPGGVGTTDLVLRSLERFWADEPARRGYWVVALEGDASYLETTGTDVVPALLDWMDEQGMDTTRVVLAGVSNGGLGAFYAAASAPGQFAGLIGLPGRFVGTLEEASRLRGLPIHLVVGAADTNWLDGARTTDRTLAQVGVPVRVTILPGQGHRLDVPVGQVMDWVDELIAEQRRRER